MYVFTYLTSGALQHKYLHVILKEHPKPDLTVVCNGLFLVYITNMNSLRHIKTKILTYFYFKDHNYIQCTTQLFRINM